jgi:large subunit ribosomal protein L6
MYEKKIEIPDSVKVEVAGNTVTVVGERGVLKREFKGVFGIDIQPAADGKVVVVKSESDDRKKKAVIGSIIAHMRNMIHGITKGYTAKLRIVYSHFPFTIKVEGDKILIQNFIGEKTNRVAKIIGSDTKIEVNGPDITVTGTDIEAVGQTSANMELVTKIKDHDQKVFQDGIYITEKPKGK